MLKSHTNRTLSLKSPMVLLWIQFFLFSVMMLAFGKLRPQLAPDSGSYLSFDFSTWQKVFSDVRTPLYPLFLKIAAKLTPLLSIVPAAQLIFHLFSVLVFFTCLRRIRFSPFMALISSTPLIFSSVAITHIPRILTESLSNSLIVISLGLYLVAVSKRSAVAWLAFSLAYFASYQTRPMYLFALPFFPLLSPVILFALTAAPSVRKSWKKVLFHSLLAVGIPYLGASSLRLLIVGQFGIVSFGGMNVIGIAGQLLKTEHVPLLPVELRELGVTFIETRQRLRQGGAVTSDGVIDYHGMAANYNSTIFNVAYPSGERFFPGNNVAINKAMSRLAWETIKLEPGNYLKLAVINFQVFLGGIFARTPFVLLFAVSLVLLYTRQLFALRINGESKMRLRTTRHSFLLLSGTITLFSLCFVLGAALLVSFVELPVGRYLDAANVFLASGMAPYVLIFFRRPRRSLGAKSYLPA